MVKENANLVKERMLALKAERPSQHDVNDLSPLSRALVPRVARFSGMGKPVYELRPSVWGRPPRLCREFQQSLDSSLHSCDVWIGYRNRTAWRGCFTNVDRQISSFNTG